MGTLLKENGFWCDQKTHYRTNSVSCSSEPTTYPEFLYAKTLRSLQKLPSDAAYRRYTEQVIKERAAAVAEETDVTKLEKRINRGQVEELIVQAENELILCRKMEVWKPWEPLIREPAANQWKWPI